MFTYVVDDEVYERLLNQSARSVGIAHDEPLMPSQGVFFSVPIEKAHGEKYQVDGVLIPKSMACPRPERGAGPGSSKPGACPGPEPGAGPGSSKPGERSGG